MTGKGFDDFGLKGLIKSTDPLTNQVGELSRSLLEGLILVAAKCLKTLVDCLHVLIKGTLESLHPWTSGWGRWWFSGTSSSQIGSRG